MALDWSKEISFSGLGKGKQGAKTAFPSKTYMNLIAEDKKQLEVRKTVLVGILLLLIVVAFAKFGVFDFYDRVNHKQAELTRLQATESSLAAQLVDYNDVLTEYRAYESSRISTDENTVSAADALALVDRYIAPYARVASIDLHGNTMSLSLADITLDAAGTLVGALNAQPIVANVTVSTATTTNQANSSDVLVTMVVTLQKVGDEQ